MCELCSGEFEQIATLEVGRAAMMRQRVNDFGAMHVVVEDANVDDENIRYCLAQPDCTDMDRIFAVEFLKLTEEERISALALAANLWGAENARLSIS